MYTSTTWKCKVSALAADTGESLYIFGNTTDKKDSMPAALSKSHLLAVLNEAVIMTDEKGNITLM